MSVLERLKAIPDPRSRRRREYPHYSLLAILILAAAHGENSLRGMWIWGKERAEQLLGYYPLGLWANTRFPSLGTFWYLLSLMDAGALEKALTGRVEQEHAYAIDGKHLRGSKRKSGKAALQVVTLVGHKLHDAIQQTAVGRQDELEAALRLLEEIDLEGKVVSADAGLLNAPLAQKVVAKKGAISA
jgi:hypothetical protein